VAISFSDSEGGVPSTALDALWRALVGRHAKANVLAHHNAARAHHDAAHAHHDAAAVNPPPLPGALAGAVPGALEGAVPGATPDAGSAVDVGVDGVVVGADGVVVGADGALSNGDEAYNPAFREVERVIARRPGHDGTSPEWLVKWRGLP
jgi:hypothetical protein